MSSIIRGYIRGEGKGIYIYGTIYFFIDDGHDKGNIHICT
jgi:hypothetical protein